MVYECRAVDIPLPLQISWTAENDQGNVINLASGASGINILRFVDISSGESVSELRFSGDTKLSSVTCTATNGDYPGVSESEFQGMYIVVMQSRITVSHV
jgi:hypothetical protein